MRQFALHVLLVLAVTAIPTPEGVPNNASTQNICDLPPTKHGLNFCEAYAERWTFNKTAGACVKYIYGGCGGTENLFLTELACNLNCDRKALLQGSNSLPSACSQPLVIGPCRAAVKRFYYNAKQEACELFDYGGCDGNENNFQTLEQCRATCDFGFQQPTISPIPLPATLKSVPSNPICSLPPTNGNICFANMPSWTFSTQSGKCEQYVYGGCNKTENLFSTKKECAARCAPAV